MIGTQDYRLSHTTSGKGGEYSESFDKLPYLRYLWEWEKRILKRVVRENFADPSSVNHLDFACGTGRITGYMESLVGNSTGVDVSDAMLEVAARNVKQSNLVKKDLTKDNIFLGQKFNLITAFRFFLNAQEELRHEALQALVPLLGPDSRFVFNIHMNKTSIHAILTRIKFWLTGRKDPFNSLSIGEVRDMLDRHGLEIHDIYQFGLLPVRVKSQRQPLKLINLIEMPASRLDFLSPLSSQLIFVSRRKRQAYTARTGGRTRIERRNSP